jgi:hypothetical protein
MAQVGLFLLLYHQIAIDAWGHGGANFVRLLGVAVLLALTPLAGRLSARIPGATVLGGVALLVACVCALRFLYETWWVIARSDLQHRAMDIAVNTHRAGTVWLAGESPYDYRCQVGVKIIPGPHVSLGPEGTHLFGLSYTYGYPYFPVMFLAYLPFRWLAPDLHSIRLGNACFYLLAGLSVALLARRCAPRAERTLAIGLSTLAFAAHSILIPELLHAAVTDMVIAMFAGFAFLALSRGSFLLAGIAFGLAQGAKLLPGPLLVLPALAYLSRPRDRVALGSSYLLTSALVLVPSLVTSPERFVSSTIAFYLARYPNGDETSLFSSLPPGFKTPFLLAGLLLALGVAGAGFYRRSSALVVPVA